MRTLHLPSVFVGIALLGLISASPIQSPRIASPTEFSIPDNLTVNVVGIPDPRDMVVIREGTSFTVPAGRVLVITGLGTATLAGSPSAIVYLRIDGMIELDVRNAATTTFRSFEPVMPGVTARSGQLVDVENIGANQDNGRAWGYLADV